MGSLIWLASYPKSGNTWVRSFLHNLLLGTEDPADINSLDTFCRGVSARAWFEQASDVPLEKLTPEGLARLRPAAQTKIMMSSRDSIFVKTHNFLGDWLGVPLHNMQITAGAIYILRNPLDVVLSLAPHFDLTLDQAIEFMGTPNARTKLSAQYVPEIYGSWSQNVESWTVQRNPQLFVVRYEDIVKDTERKFGEMARFLGLRPSDERLERAIKNSSFEILQSQERSRGFREKPEKAEVFFRKGTPEQWRAELSDDQVRRIISVHRQQMERFGYIPEDYR